MRTKHYLYNAFTISEGKTRIAIDPGQNLWMFNKHSLIPVTDWKEMTHVLVTHGDPDHFKYAVPMAKESGAAVVCGDQLVQDFSSEGLQNTHPLSVGETIEVDDIELKGIKVPNTMDTLAAIQAVKNISPCIVIPCHYNVPYEFIKNVNPTDDSFFKKEVEKLGVACRIMSYGDELFLEAS